jgi:2-polyprenyl-3-methyl-5-hydroxy-6-metoxy-1,4-benzoquinol methylase
MFEDLLGSGKKQYTQYLGFCRNCGFLFTQNPFTSEQLENRYKKMSKFEYDATTYVLSNDYKRQSIRQKHFIEENIDLNQIHSVLEVGASSGYNLSLYKEQRRVLGIEPSQLNCQLSMKNYGVTLFNGMFNEYLEQGKFESFDLVFLSMVLEHIVNPREFIESLDRYCSRYMFIEIPTLDLRSKEEPMGIFAEEHVNLFTLDSLNELMTRVGYSLVNVENIYGIKRYLPAGYPAIATLWEKTGRNRSKKKDIYNIFSAEECLDKYIRNSEEGLVSVRQIIDEIPNSMKLALWGVGHHASMLLANTKLNKKNIVRVYDSDERKHGMQFAGTKISAFDKNDIDNNQVEGILLTTYTAQKAIISYIEKQNIDCPIITLYEI